VLIEIKTPANLEINSLDNLPMLRIFMEQNNIKLNKSKLARDLGVDRKTVTKYLDGFQKSEHRKKGSTCDSYYDIIHELLNSKTQLFQFRTVLYRYLVDNEGFQIPQQTFFHYLKRIPEFDNYFTTGKMSNANAIPVIRYETAPGIQAQLDWKEKIPFVLKNGETIEISVLTLILGYSRFRVYKPSIQMTQDVLIHLMTEAFENLGGVPKVVLTDNMRTVMDASRTLSSPGKVNCKFEAFAKDFGFQTKTCVAATPRTKGKVESQQKFLAEIQAYSGKLNLVELYDLVERINKRVNCSISQGTGKFPMKEFEKEKDSLLPLPNESIRNQYHIKTKPAKVNPAGMIAVDSCQYSVPKDYIGKEVKYQVHDSNVYVYFNTKLIAMHRKSERKLNYSEEHYTNILSMKFYGKDPDEVRKIAKENLNLIGGVFST